MNFKSSEQIHDFLLPIAEELGIELVEIAFTDKDRTLTVFIDTEEGVDLDTCEKFHNAIMDPIDELDPSFGAPYTLNVSSPGLDRPFRTPRDFERNLGKEVEIKLYAPVKGSKFIEGVLLAYDDNSVTVSAGKEELKLQCNRIAKINKAIKFE